MKRIFMQALCAISVYIAPCFSWEIDTVWTKTYISAGEAKCACETNDGGFIVVGNIPQQDGSLNKDICLLRTNSNGDSIWVKKFGTANNEFGYAVATVSDGGFLVVGYRWRFFTWVIRTNAAGDSIWTRDLPYTIYPANSNVLETIGNDTYAIATDSGLVIMDAAGNYRFLTSTACDVVSRTADGDFILGDVFTLTKVNSLGTALWSKNIGSGFSLGLIKSVRESKDQGLFVALNVGLYTAMGPKLVLMKVTANGDTVWTHLYGTGEDQGLDLLVLSDGSMLVTGKTRTYHPYYGFWLIRLDANGGSLWMPNTNDPVVRGTGWSIRPTRDDGYIIAGEKGGACLMKFKKKTSTTVHSETPTQQKRAVIISIDGNYRLTIPFNSGSDAAISLRIFDMRGRFVGAVNNQSIANGEDIHFPVNSTIPNGKYWYTISTEGYESSGSFFYMK